MWTAEMRNVQWVSNKHVDADRTLTGTTTLTQTLTSIPNLTLTI